MSATKAAPADLPIVPAEIAKGIQDIKNLATCKICTRLMYEPYTTKCGHTFCYGCLSKWLGHEQRKRQCPDCRARIKDEPAPNYTIRGIVHVLIGNSAFIEDDETPDSLLAEQLEESGLLENDKTGPDAPGLFKGLFKVTHHDPIRDASDGVMRCPHCNWEVEDDYCEHCDVDFDDHFWADWSDDGPYLSSDDSLLADRYGDIGGVYTDEDEDDSDEPNEEDEAFIDDEDVGLGNSDNEVEETGFVERRVRFDDDGSVDGTVSRVPGGVTTARNASAARDTTPDWLVHSRARRHARQFHDARTGSEDSTIGASDSGATDSDDDSQDGLDSGNDSDDDSNDDSEDTSDDDSNDDSRDESSSDTDDEPIIHHRSAARRATNSSRQPTSSHRSPGRRQRSNVVDLTTLPSPDTYRPRNRRHGSSTTTSNEAGSAAASSSRTRVLREEQELDGGSETEPPLPVRPRKRVRIVLSDSDGDNDPVDVQRDTRTQRRRLNRSACTLAVSNRAHRSIAQPRFSHPLVGTLPPERSLPW